jgi:hypothetical protein
VKARCPRLAARRREATLREAKQWGVPADPEQAKFPEEFHPVRLDATDDRAQAKFLPADNHLELWDGLAPQDRARCSAVDHLEQSGAWDILAQARHSVAGRPVRSDEQVPQDRARFQGADPQGADRWGVGWARSKHRER